MIVLTGVNFADKENMYKQTKHTLRKFMGGLTKEDAEMGQNVRLEPAWKSARSSYRKGCAQHRNIGCVKKRLNPVGPDGKIVLCHSCGSYRHLVAECQDSWENIAKRKTSEFNVKLWSQSDQNKRKGDENRSRESVELGEVCSVPIPNKQLVEEVTQLKADIRNLKTEIEKIMVVKDKELKIQKKEFLSHVRIVEQENEGQQKESGTTLQMLFQSIMKLQKEVKLLGTEDYDRQTSKKEMKLNENNRTKQRLLEKAKKVKLNLQMTPEQRQLETQAWTVVTEMSKEKQAVAVALSLPEDDERKIKEKVFGELQLDVLSSENGMGVLFKFLDKYLLEDELMNSWNKFEDFEKFERKPGQNIREYVADFDLKFRKLEKLNIKLPSEILAFKLLKNANLRKQERMIVLTGVNFADKENMYKQTKHTLRKFMGGLTKEDAEMGQNVRLEPAWKSARSSYRKGCAQHRNIGCVKKRLNPVGPDGKIVLCHSCGSYRHLVAECQDSWENIAKRKTSEFNVKLWSQSDQNKRKGDENRSRESVELGEVCSVPIPNKQLVEEVTQLKADIRNLKTEIEKIMVVKDKELKIQKKEFLSHVRIVEQENEGQQKESGTTLQMLFQSIMKLQKEVKLLGTEDYDRQTSKKEMKLNENNRTKQRLLEKAKKVKLNLQMTPEQTKTSSWISEKKMKKKLDTDKASQVRQWFWWPVERQQINYTTLQSTTGNFFL